jgi:hypothetical protein
MMIAVLLDFFLKKIKYILRCQHVDIKVTKRHISVSLNLHG